MKKPSKLQEYARKRNFFLFQLTAIEGIIKWLLVWAPLQHREPHHLRMILTILTHLKTTWKNNCERGKTFVKQNQDDERV